MNLNHDADKDLLEAIDKVIETQQASGNEVLDELATTRPVARVPFQNTLEDRLLAHFEQLKQGETPMVTSQAYLPASAPRRNWLPLTLLAALIVVGVAGIMLINGRGKSSLPNEIALAAITASATHSANVNPTTVAPVSNATLSAHLPPNLIAISIPLAHLTSDSLIPGVGGNVDIVALLPFKASNPNLNILPVTAMPDGTQSVETTLVRDAMVIFHSPVSQANPPDASATITFAVSPEESRQLAWLGEQPQVMFRLQKPLPTVVPMGSSVMVFPFDMITADENIQPGDRVDIISTCAFVPDIINTSVTDTSKTDCSQESNAKRALNVRVVSGEILANGSPSVKTSNNIAIAVPEESMPMFAQMMDARMHFKLIKSSASGQPTPTPQPTLTRGKVAVDIPSANVAPLAEGMRLIAGNTYVDVIANFNVKDINDQAPAQFQALVSAQQGNSQISQRVVRGALVVKSGDILTLQVTPAEAEVIHWLLSVNIVLTVRPALPTDGRSPKTLQLHLESLSSWSTDHLEVGDTVDVVMAFVIGTNPTYTLNFKAYGSASWGDKLSDGEITANVYAPAFDILPSDSMFIRRVVQNATVIAVKSNTDPQSGRLGSVDLTLEVTQPMTSPTLESLKGYMDARMPYLVVKH